MRFHNIFIAAALADENGDDGTVEETTCLTDELRYYFCGFHTQAIDEFLFEWADIEF